MNQRISEPDIPPYRWEAVPDPNKYGVTTGCYGCDFKPLSTGIRCSRIPCQQRPGQVAKIIHTPGDAAKNNLHIK